MSVDTSTQSFETTWGADPSDANAAAEGTAWYDRVNWFGVGGILCMYVIMVSFGLWASRKKGQNVEAGGNEMEANMVAGRNIGVIVGCFTMTATWVGGGYINATAEKVFSKGLIWCQAPFGYAMSLFFGGIFFAKKFREREYITMLDPFQNKFGAKMGGFIFIPCVLGELMWCASILSALGSALSVILGISIELGVIVSTVTAVAYTLVGGLFAVAYVDIIQLVTVALGLIISVPFAFNTEHRLGNLYDKIPTNLGNIFRDDGENYADGNHTFSDLWLGNLKKYQVGSYLDVYILLICGGIPWQAYFQRVLSVKQVHHARILSFVAAFGCFFMAIPSVLIGAVASTADWHGAGYNVTLPLPEKNAKFVLPMTLQYMTPPAITFVGLGAVTAAVMSSADSSILGASSMFVRNVYQIIFRPNASQKELGYCMKVTVVCAGAIAIALALAIPSIYGLFKLCSDLVFVIVFPQLVMVTYVPWSNLYGAISGYAVSLVLRLLGGEPLIHLPPTIKYPYYDEHHYVGDSKEIDHEGKGQLFPFRTFSMMMGLMANLLVCYITHKLFTTQYLSKKWDLLQAIDPEAMLNSHSSSEEDNANSLDEKYGKDKRETYPMSEAKKNPEATGKLLDQPSV